MWSTEHPRIVIGVPSEITPVERRAVKEACVKASEVHEVLQILESIIDQTGDLIEGRSPELVAAARAALNRYSDDSPAEAE